MAKWTYIECIPLNGSFDIYKDNEHMSREFCSGSVSSAQFVVRRFKREWEENGRLGRRGEV